MSGVQIAIIPVTAFQQNCALVWERQGRQAMVVDPGGEPGRVLDAVSRLDLRVEVVVLTHGHLDHAGGARAFKEEYNRRIAPAGRAPIELIGPDARDAFLLQSIETEAAKYGLRGMLNATPDRFLAEGDTVTVGPMTWRVLHTPGHTPGHISFVNEADRIAIVGDVLFRGSVGRTDFPYGDHAALIAGIREKLLPLGDDMHFLCGHGEGSTFGAERQGNPFLA
jgi:glyoxylase-like metal-dependent hydrolase (beta-lactamase superfamily II)